VGPSRSAFSRFATKRTSKCQNCRAVIFAAAFFSLAAKIAALQFLSLTRRDAGDLPETPDESTPLRSYLSVSLDGAAMCLVVRSQLMNSGGTRFCASRTSGSSSLEDLSAECQKRQRRMVAPC
jgi:hypothetical protein